MWPSIVVSAPPFSIQKFSNIVLCATALAKHCNMAQCHLQKAEIYLSKHTVHLHFKAICKPAFIDTAAVHKNKSSRN